MEEKSTTANAKKVILKEAISDDYLLGRYISDWKGRIPSTLLNIMSIHGAKNKAYWIPISTLCHHQSQCDPATRIKKYSTKYFPK